MADPCTGCSFGVITTPNRDSFCDECLALKAECHFCGSSDITAFEIDKKGGTLASCRKHEDLWIRYTTGAL